MASKTPIDSAKIQITDALTVIYQGKPVGSIKPTGRTFNEGKEIVWNASRTGNEVYYSPKAAAIAEAEQGQGQGK